MLSIENLTMSVRDHQILRGVSVEVAEGETVGLVGESGSGKSTTARAALRILPDGAEVSGNVTVCGHDATNSVAVREVRRTLAAMIFQEPRSVLNPVRRIGDSAAERLVYVHGMPKSEARQRISELFVEVGLKDVDRLLRCYPHQLSGGMLQRVVIAAALSITPRLLLADEATSALDVTTQAEVLALLRRLQREREMGVLFITHDLRLAAAYCDRVYVMKEGSIVDHQKGDAIFVNPTQQYTKALADAVPLLPERDSTVRA
ncbi:ABC transporter ATP-binding protein [Kibdelosporangium philippinense]|uniref:ABC transporter ATP-binding protein n=1 Tax=Kibdelosporangium philippinense TaxID=211113 RepID=A0ABS8ZAC1_9PSEU|nr:ABC transporter ATP-binding protein [Kibdelosporangium philippinense]MCE7004760.1 ABC transporter ATP-binding protein [Kibdelosporangium philippinense]